MNMSNILSDEDLIHLGWDGKMHCDCGKPMLYNSAYDQWFCLSILHCGKRRCNKCKGFKEPLYCPECLKKGKQIEMSHIKVPEANYFMCNHCFYTETGWIDERHTHGYFELCNCE